MPQNVVNLAFKLKEKFFNSKIGLSNKIQRHGIEVADKIDEVIEQNIVMKL